MLLLSSFPISRCWPRLPGVLLCTLALAGCGKDEAAAPAVAGGDPKQGQQLIAQYQCAACHQIPEVPGAHGNAGPPLVAFGHKSYIAGGIPNVPENLIRWLDNPQAMKPGTLMPDVGVSPEEARHMAAYLYTLE
jgi:cytochrome c